MARGPLREPPTCIFCEAQGPLTQEHIVSQWISKQLRGSDPAIRFIHRAHEHAMWKSDFTKEKIDLAPRVVCGDCNSGWMNVLETEMQDLLPPMINGAQTHLSTGAQRQIATWAIMKFVVAEWVSPKREIHFSQQGRDALRETLRPLDGCFLWVAEYAGPDRSGTVAGANTTGPRGGFAGVYCIGHLLILLGIFKGLGTFVVQNDFLASAIPIWPSAGPIVWPQTAQWDEADILTLVDDPPFRTDPLPEE